MIMYSFLDRITTYYPVSVFLSEPCLKITAKTIKKTIKCCNVSLEDGKIVSRSPLQLESGVACVKKTTYPFSFCIFSFFLNCMAEALSPATDLSGQRVLCHLV